MRLLSRQILLILAFCLIIPNAFALIEPNKNQRLFLEADIKNRLGQLIDYWRAADFNSIYDNLANSKSTKLITREIFIESFNRKNWLPSNEEPFKILQIKFIELSRVLLHLEINFQNRRNSSITTKREAVLDVTYEELENSRAWLFDLLPILRIIN